ncbi:MAG: hypothetical protein IKN59_02360 [Paludibacteraceae bacterium]|nr:hypothetical protein [Paludibacteraceae bacterium]
MKNLSMAMALCIVCALASSCVNKEQKIATEYLKDSMKSPSSFKVISVEKESIPARISYDTTYHIKNICKHSYKVDSVIFDSIKIWRSEYPKHLKFFIEYDAANSYGAIIRETEEVCVVNDKPFLWEEFITNVVDDKKLDHVEAYKKTIYHDILFTVDGEEWIYDFQLGEDDIF